MIETGRSWRAALALSAALMLAACGTTGGNSSGARAVAGPGQYVVQPGDTMYRIALKTGRSVADIARWNGMSNPDSIEVGQVLRVAPPGGSAVPPTTEADASRLGSGSAERARSARPSAPPEKPEPTPPASRRADWGWPVEGAVTAGFNGTSNKGVDLGAKAGDAVSAMATGTVAVTEELRGYGSVVMVDHGGGYMSVYTNLKTLQVKKGQRVNRGQKIAEVGGDAKLHFEIRHRGNAVDPRQYLPAR